MKPYSFWLLPSFPPLPPFPPFLLPPPLPPLSPLPPLVWLFFCNFPFSPLFGYFCFCLLGFIAGILASRSVGERRLQPHAPARERLRGRAGENTRVSPWAELMYIRSHFCTRRPMVPPHFALESSGPLVDGLFVGVTATAMFFRGPQPVFGQATREDHILPVLRKCDDPSRLRTLGGGGSPTPRKRDTPMWLYYRTFGEVGSGHCLSLCLAEPFCCIAFFCWHEVAGHSA